MIPALFINMSRRFEEASKVSAACLMEANEARSRSRKVMLALGSSFLISAMVASALALVLAPRKILDGLCLANWYMLYLPRPMLPPVTRITLPLRSGISLSGLKDTIMAD